jgi:phenylpropionate dioxygenase-like ring-hydroxylating dioxygenase large terminal subunit
MMQRNLALASAGTIEQEPDVFRVPAVNYFDPDRWRLEVDRIFKRLPLMLAFSSELAEPNSYKSMDVAGVPLLLTRGTDGAVRAFVNMCSHRGAIVVPEGSGSGRRFTCPYHGWSYDPKGSLVGILSREDFGTVDASCLGLTPLPAGERAGMVFATVTPGAWFDLDGFLGGYDDLLGHFGFEDWHIVARRTIAGPNWKVAYDGYLDFYHLPILHRNSFGPDLSNRATYDAWGPHQRVTSPDPRLLALASRPDSTWETEKLMGGVWTIFPHVSIATFEAGGRGALVSQLFPGADADSSVTVQSYFIDHEPDDEERELAQKQADFLEHVVRDEDYATGLGIQRSVKTGAKSEFLFGRNEGGGHRFHQWVDRLLALDDAELAGVFDSTT